MRHGLYFGFLALAVLALTGCDVVKQTITGDEKALSDAQIAKLIPARVKNAKSWAADMADIFDTLSIKKDAQNICTAIAVIDQESNFAADPAVPNLGNAALKAIDEKLEDKLGKNLAGVFRTMLETRPSPANSFIKQIQAVKTEKQLDELYRQIFDYFTQTYKVAPLTNITRLSGQGLDERINPVTTLGSMQVHIDYARSHRRASMSDRDLRADLYSQYGGLYYGIHRLLTYPANYDKPLYRFADYNSGMYSSRNAAFQQRVATLTGQTLAIDGDLLLYNDGTPLNKKSATEIATIKLLATATKPVSERQIRSDFKKEKTQGFENTVTYRTVSELFDKQTGRKSTYAIMPQVVISGPKLSRDFDTNWFATRVDKRYQNCIATAKRLKLS
ncbi:Protein of unknown function [Moraxella cuniculi DSM 21768]|uniref:DUF1615 domain-containing protein n=2 Tax=Moraxella cuniculi TaxID=34061 RepID=A0A1N7FAJ7_9GAMM|nr:DUF1615 domain-containing protein [Moraxella cuniculi]OOS03604.1 hypothetical protein B0189_09340 [Moraxella cuniculi]SIR97302.1 Protein of unknown function [Moraxella cuniculi DSM 21768]VEG12442.1 Protein of uncharacterised function (DUF1615) [Moraxella cuniculi]